MSTLEATQRRAGRFSDIAEAMLANPPRFATNEEVAEWERREREAAFRQRLSLARVPQRFARADLATCRGEAVMFVDRTAAGEFGNLVLGGPSGTGKTHTACAVLRAWMWRTGKMGRFATMDGILRDVRGSYGHSERESEVLERYANAPMLVIDEFGKERPTEWSLPMIESIVNDRYAARRPTVITTQYHRDRLAERFAAVDGDAERAVAVVRRLLDCAVVTGASVDG